MQPDLEQQPRERLANALRGRAVVLLSSWERAVRRGVGPAAGLSPGELRDASRSVIDHIIDVLATGGRAAWDGLAERTSEHGRRRFEQGYAVSDVLAEYRLLRREVLGQVHPAVDGGLSADEVVALNGAVDLVCQGAVTAFTNAQRSHLERAAEVEAKFLSFLAHDQRNHLNHALLLLEVQSVELAEYPELAQSLDDLRVVREAIRETASGMERLMQAERLRRGGVAAERQPVRPGELVRSLAAGFTAEVVAKGLRLECAVADAGELTSDPGLLGLALTNLIGNAVKFSTGGVVRVSADPIGDGSGYRFAVADQGPGIAGDRVEQLFDAFVRGETHGQGGMGLGLSIASQAVRLLGGRLAVASTVGVGSTFTFAVPGDPPAA